MAGASPAYIYGNMVIETERLILQEADLTDSEFIFELLNSPTWLEHIGDRGIRTMDDAANYIENSLFKSYRENGFGLYKVILKNDDTPIGLCGILNRDTLDHPDIGFALLPVFAGKGFAFEAVAATMEFAQHHLQIDPVLAITSKANTRSQKLLEKIGLSNIGTIGEEGEKEELLLYSTAKAGEKK